ncbi:MAG: hypothetical protein KatS3mg043_0569 [Rhodothermaceae bacterium]|nr:MAG: hypothetical protein KatS3mg043_0569 [Rhodothermaceae bacterium]
MKAPRHDRYTGFLLLLTLGTGLATAQPVIQPFTFDLVRHTLPHVEQGFLSWGDYDNDGDLDVVVTGRGAAGLHAALYRNDGKSDDETVRFTDAGAGLPPVLYSRSAWFDLDGDGDLDLVLSGSRTETPPFIPVTLLYRNDDGRLVPLEAGLEPLHSGAVAPADYDNDGDTDLLLAGIDAAGRYRGLLYRNDGGTLTLARDDLRGGTFGAAAWGDYDDDGDLDLALSGASETDGFATLLYRNDAGTLTPQATALEPVAFGSLAWGDYDDDGDLDLALSGGRLSLRFFEGTTRLYRNDGGTLQATDDDLPGILAGHLAWGDYDDDGDLDLALSGAFEAGGRRTARLLRNDGAGGFVTATFFIGAIFAATDWGDYDGDGDLDLLASGLSTAGLPFTNLYENQRQVIPPPPPPPAALQATVEGHTVHLQWDPPASGRNLTYNLRVGRAPGGHDVLPVPADPATGHLRLPRPGNVAHHTTWTLRNLPGGIYYWSVQALDPALRASAFAAEGTFTVEAATGVTTAPPDRLPDRPRLHPAHPNPFRTTTTFRLELPHPQPVTLHVYNVLGARVATLHDGPAEAGTHTLRWDGRDATGRPLGAGLYVYELHTGDRLFTGKVILLP